MANKYHISKDGVARPCGATKIACRLGGDDQHYTSKEAAMNAAAAKTAKESSTLPKQMTKKPAKTGAPARRWLPRGEVNADTGRSILQKRREIMQIAKAVGESDASKKTKLGAVYTDFTKNNPQLTEKQKSAMAENFSQEYLIWNEHYQKKAEGTDTGKPINKLSFDENIAGIAKSSRETVFLLEAGVLNKILKNRDGRYVTSHDQAAKNFMAQAVKSFEKGKAERDAVEQQEAEEKAKEQARREEIEEAARAAKASREERSARRKGFISKIFGRKLREPDAQ